MNVRGAAARAFEHCFHPPLPKKLPFSFHTPPPPRIGPLRANGGDTALRLSGRRRRGQSLFLGEPRVIEGGGATLR